MELSGELRIDAPRDQVWQALNDEAILQASIPGCRELRRDDENTFSATVSVKIGIVNATMKGRVTISDVTPQVSYTLTGEGQGVVGFAKGTTRVLLSDIDAETTLLNYSARAEIGGKLASIGSRLVDSVARSMAEKFFAAFRKNIGAKTVETA
ncbi:carbon monoxide dehydrogenase subunit G [Corticibacterium sp. UT-5YL-CI-8]|nr:carbon monoxide dehydrogenase subunit G [Tianweitania sp. UT-5YL-CI-8]